MIDEPTPAAIIAKAQATNREARDSLRRYLIDRAEALRAARSGLDHEAIERELASLERWIMWLRAAV